MPSLLQRLLHRPMTLAEGLKRGRADNYLWLRHIAAGLLIYSHSYALAPAAAGRSDVIAAFLPRLYGGKVAVLLFFAISGFLVTSSYLNHPSLWRFVKARILRIYPAYAVCLVSMVIVTGLGFTSLSAREFFGAPETWSYLSSNVDLIGLRYTLPGAYAASAYPGVVNGSLWSLALEVRLYAYLVLLAACGVLKWRALATALLLAYIAGMLWFGSGPDAEGKHALTLVFAATAAAACAARYVPVSTRLLGLAVGIAWLLRDSALAYGLELTCIAYFSVWFAYRIPALPLRFPGDYSYGLFLYGFPAQQMIVQLDPGIGPLRLTLFAITLATALAVVSWHGIERYALSLKDRPVQRLIPATADQEAVGEKI